MRRYEDKKKEIVIVRECVEASCGMCGRKAEYPEQIDHNAGFEYCSMGVAQGTLCMSSSIDSERDVELLRVCHMANGRDFVW